MNRTIAYLLAGGQGSRLSLLASTRAKPAVPFGGLYRIIDFSLSCAMHAGISRIGILTQYRPASLMTHVDNGGSWDFHGPHRVAKVLPPFKGVNDSDWYRGTADAVYQNLGFLQKWKPETVVVLSGDHIYHMDLAEMVGFHRSKGADVTVAVQKVPLKEASRFGLVITDGTSRVSEFEEKPANPSSDLASMGIYVFDAKVLEEILTRLTPEGAFDFGSDILPHMVDKNNVFAYQYDGYWRDVGTLIAFWQANMDSLPLGRGLDLKNWRIRTNLDQEGLYISPPAKVFTQAEISNSSLAPGCVIEGAVSNSILFPGVRVEAGARVHDSIIMHNTVVKKNARVERAIIDKCCEVGAGSILGEHDRDRELTPNTGYPHILKEGLTVLGRTVRIGDNVTLGTNSLIFPQHRISAAENVPEGACIQ